MTNTPEHKLTLQQSDRLEKLKACGASGKSMKAFALSEGFDIIDLYSWKKINSNGHVKRITKSLP